MFCFSAKQFSHFVSPAKLYAWQNDADSEDDNDKSEEKGIEKISTSSDKTDKEKYSLFRLGLDSHNPLTFIREFNIYTDDYVCIHFGEMPLNPPEIHI